MVHLFGYDLWALGLALVAGLACGFLNTAASSGTAVSLPLLMMIGLDPVTANATNRIPVLIGAISATSSFHRKKLVPWGLAIRVSLPVTVGALIGAALAEVIPGRDLGLIITGALLFSLLMLFTKLKGAIENAPVGEIRYGNKEILIFMLIGVWLGFIVLDGATYLLLALTLGVSLPLIQSNAVKSAALIPTSIIAIVVFAMKGNLDWTLGLITGAGSIAGGLLGARLASHEPAKKWIFRLLVAVILAELAHLAMHYIFKTKGF